MHIICGYHGNCTDGIAAEWVVKSWVAPELAGSPSYSKRAMEYNQDSYDLLLEEAEAAADFEVGEAITIVLVDFSVPLVTLRALEEVASATEGKVILLDHHKTAYENLASIIMLDPADFPEGNYSPVTYTSESLVIKLDMAESGATLARKHFFPEAPIPLALQYVRDRDLWLHELPHTKEINMYISCMARLGSFEELAWSMQTALGRQHAIEEGSQMLADYDKEIERICDKAVPIQLGTVKMLASRCLARYASDAGSILASRAEGGIGFLVVDSNNPQAVGVIPSNKYSLRSIAPDGPDVSAIAKAYGGGGHKHAAGIEMENTLVATRLSPEGERYAIPLISGRPTEEL